MKHRILTVISLIAATAALLTACKPDNAPDTVTDEITETDTAAVTEPSPGFDGELHVSVYPEPQSIRVSVRGIDSADASALTPSDSSYNGVFAHFGFSCAENGLPVTVITDGALSEEEYKLSVRSNGVTLTAAGSRGVYNAVSTLSQLCDQGRIAAADVEDKPSVPLRGVIEGFYGEAWTHSFRLELLSFMGRYKLNAYIYAPKDDPKHRAKWREAYTGEELEKMKELCKTAADNNVRFIYALSPGLDIDLGEGYGGDLEKLFSKCDAMYELGVRDFAILLDDIESHDAKGHAALVNDFQRKFVKTHEGCADLIMISPEFCDAMLTGYTDGLAPLLDADIKVMWTGSGVVPASITGSQLEKINKKLGRNVLIWWNYPVNDTMTDRLFLGPCENLGGDLPEHISGLVSNPMNQGHASMLPLLTVADMMWNTASYDPERSVKEAVTRLMPDQADGLYAFMDLCRASVINGERSSLSIAGAIRDYDPGKNNSELLSQLEKMSLDLSDLEKNGDRAFISETEPWLSKARAFVDSAVALLGFDAAQPDAKPELAVRFVSAYERTRNNAATVSADVLAPFLSAAKTRVNSVLGDAPEITFEKATAFTDCRVYEDHSADYIADGDDSTFFWSAGSLQQASDGGKGYVGIRFPSAVTVRNVYITTGNNGRDVLSDIILEYSTDEKNWKKLAAGSFGSEVYFEKLSITAKALRVRCGDQSSPNWVIIRSFEANTTRRPASSGRKVDTNMPTYQNYVPENAFDGDQTTVFWSSAAPTVNGVFTVDLGSVADVSGVRLTAGGDGHPDDYIHSGVLEYSADGAEYTKLCDVNGRVTKSAASFRARYVRVRCTAAQTNWVIISEFEIDRKFALPDGVSFDGDGSIDFYPLTDRDVFTVFAPAADELAGKMLTFDTSGCDSLELYLTSYEGISVAASGEEVSLSAHTVIDVKNSDSVTVTFNGAPFGIAEVVKK